MGRLAQSERSSAISTSVTFGRDFFRPLRGLIEYTVLDYRMKNPRSELL
jgi:hypothetical protein